MIRLSKSEARKLGIGVKKPKKRRIFDTSQCWFKGGFRGCEMRLPFPPSANHCFPSNRGGVRTLSTAGSDFRAAVQEVTKERSILVGPVKVEIHAFPPDERSRDIDNFIKPILDALQAARVIQNDKEVVELKVVKRFIEFGGCVIVNVSTI